MENVIQLLPDALANQIAAGEVVQRPASVVKELMENAIDARAQKITLLIKDGGKALIQVIDDGSGMSETDARLSFERHATSKIKCADDLFAIKTMGFRGEALASIAAVAQVEMKTRKASEELGTRILVEGSKVVTQEPCQTPQGTNIAVRNLFYNVPARKQFLKADSKELKLAEDEFIRIALSHPEVQFVMYINDRETYKLPAENLRQRIVNLFSKAKSLNQNLVPIAEDTDVLKLSGFIGTPDVAKRRGADQFIFVNQRFIKSYYLSHALKSAYDEVLPEEYSPFYVLFLEIDPDKIDVNVHPTKQEIKFEDERIIYNYLKVAARHALSQYHVTPTLDFEQDRVFRLDDFRQQPSNPASSGYSGTGFSKPGNATPFQKEEKSEWVNYYESLFQPKKEVPNGDETTSDESFINMPGLASSGSEEEQDLFDESADWTVPEPFQVHQSYILCHIRSGLMIIDQQAAHERILYEKYLEWMENDSPVVQQELFPKVISLKGGDLTILKNIQPDLVRLGLIVEPFGQDEFIVHGTPSINGILMDGETLLMDLIEQYKEDINLSLGVAEKSAAALARSTAIKRGKKLTKEEMQTLADQLFSCELPYKSPSGRKCFITMEMDDLENRFKK